MRLDFTGTVRNGQLPPELSRVIRDLLRRLEGKKVRVSVQEHKRKRSCNQNAFYWAVVVPMVLEMFRGAGNDCDEELVHHYLKEHVGGLVSIVRDPSGTPKTVVGSTTALSTQEFEDYLERIRAWAAAFGVEIPLPRELNEEPTERQTA